MRPGTSKGDFSLACMEVRLDKTHQQGTTCTATPLWHGHLQRAAVGEFSNFLRRHLIENKKLAKKVYANQRFYLTILYSVIHSFL